MFSRVFLLSILVLSVGLIGSASAHKSTVIEGYNLEVGWDTEPPIVGMENSITVAISRVTLDDQMNSDEMDSMMNHDGMTNDTMSHDEMKHDGMTNDTMSHDEMKHDGMTNDTMSHSEMALDDEEDVLLNGVTGLASTLEVTITLNDIKTNLTMIEDAVPGLYAGAFTPSEPGFPTVHLFTTIEGTPIEATMHPEEVKEGTNTQSVTSDGSIIITVIATAPEEDNIMNITVEFTDADGNPIENVNYDVIATQSGTTVLDETNVHTDSGDDNHFTESLSSDSPVEVQIKILGVGNPEEMSTWTGPKDEAISVQVVPEFGSIAAMILAISIISIIAVTGRSKIIPRF